MKKNNKISSSGKVYRSIYTDLYLFEKIDITADECNRLWNLRGKRSKVRRSDIVRAMFLLFIIRDDFKQMVLETTKNEKIKEIEKSKEREVAALLKKLGATDK